MRARTSCLSFQLMQNSKAYYVVFNDLRVSHKFSYLLIATTCILMPLITSTGDASSTWIVVKFTCNKIILSTFWTSGAVSIKSDLLKCREQRAADIHRTCCWCVCRYGIPSEMDSSWGGHGSDVLYQIRCLVVWCSALRDNHIRTCSLCRYAMSHNIELRRVFNRFE